MDQAVVTVFLFFPIRCFDHNPVVFPHTKKKRKEKKKQMRRSSSVGFQAVDDAKRSQVTLRQDAMRETHLKVTGLAAERKSFMK